MNTANLCLRTETIGEGEEVFNSSFSSDFNRLHKALVKRAEKTLAGIIKKTGEWLKTFADSSGVEGALCGC